MVESLTQTLGCQPHSLPHSPRIALEDPAFVVHTGDLVGDGASESNWSTFFDVEAALIRDVALYPSLGNHEGDGLRYLELFAPPDDLSPSSENYYAFTFATSALVVLDLYRSSFGVGSTQYNWLETALQALAEDPVIQRRFVFLHHGPYDSGPHGSEHTVRSDLIPLFQAYGVDAVFSGHDHTYERSTVDDIKYVVTGGGGAPLYTADGDWWTQVTEAVLHYVVIEVEGPRAAVTVRRLDNSVVDHFVLGNNAGECQDASTCADRAPGPCEADEEGAWVCLYGGCVWNCAFGDPTPGPDGGVAPGPDAGRPPGFDAGTITQPPTVGAGCGCRQGRPPGSHIPWGLLLAVGLVLVCRRRRLEPLGRALNARGPTSGCTASSPRGRRRS